MMMRTNNRQSKEILARSIIRRVGKKGSEKIVYNYERGFEVLGLQDIVEWCRASRIQIRKYELAVETFCKGALNV